LPGSSGDEADESSFSPYSGNVNTLVLPLALQRKCPFPPNAKGSLSLSLSLSLSGSSGDEADESGFSPYPGNVNTLVLQLVPYAAALAATGGSMPEFVNPKYKDASKRSFKKPTRLECMMQELPKLLPLQVWHLCILERERDFRRFYCVPSRSRRDSSA